eukprot:3476495-Karenia_brevis.AAC.1
MTSQWPCDVNSQGHASQDVMDLHGGALQFCIATDGHTSPVSSYPASESTPDHASPALFDADPQ